jgi:CBS domain-containing protein
MKVREIMTTGVECVTPGTTLQEAAQRMKSLDTGFLAVCDNDRLIGAVTDRDITIRSVAEGLSLDTPVEDIMTKDVFYCYDDYSVETAAEFMAKKEVKRLLILNRDKRLVGVVSIGDLSKVEGIQGVVGDTLKDISEAA